MHNKLKNMKIAVILIMAIFMTLFGEAATTEVTTVNYARANAENMTETLVHKLPKNTVYIDTAINYGEYLKRESLKKNLYDFNTTASHMSVSSIKVVWNQNLDFEYEITCSEINKNDKYAHNIYIQYPDKNICYITGLRENTEYEITVKNITKSTQETIKAKTEQVIITQTFEYEDGWTNCFAFEAATGLTKSPSKDAIQGSIKDPVTNTGIMRNEQGDYCVAMGLYYGVCNDRFLVELENGTQFTVKICDSKGLASDGEGRYHHFGDTGKCIIEFIHSDYLPERLTVTGNYGCDNWYGLNFDNIKSIKKIDNGDIITY